MLNKILSLSFALLLITGLSACSDDSAVEAPAETEERPAGVIPQAQLNALETANGLADTLQAQEEERRKRMEEQGI